jgi:hypothetical protein
MTLSREGLMDKDLARVAAAAGIDHKIVDKLEQILSGPNDRAFVVCSYADCNQNQKGQCTIFTVQDVPRMKRGQPCNRYDNTRE